MWRLRQRERSRRSWLAITITPGPSVLRASSDLRTHEGYDWVYVLNGMLRLVLGEHDLVLRPGEAAEFDTRTPRWFGATSAGPVEYLSLIGKQGERAAPRSPSAG